MPTRLGLRLSLDSGSVPRFDPRSIANLDWWLDVSDSNTVYDSVAKNDLLTTTAPCGWVVDKAGSNHDILQSSASLMPTWTTGLQNGLPGIIFNSNSYYTLASNYSWPASSTVFVVAKITDTAGYKTLVTGQTNSLDVRWDATERLDVTQENITDATSATTANSTSAASLSTVVCRSNTGVDYRLNGAANGTGLALSITAATTEFGRYVGANSYFQSTLHEFLVFGRQLTATEIGLVESYLNRKWLIY